MDTTKMMGEYFDQQRRCTENLKVYDQFAFGLSFLFSIDSVYVIAHLKNN